LLSAGNTLDQYTIIELIAKGGMGEIYLANDMVLDRLVAIKCLSEKLSSDPKFVERFYQEAKATASVVHSNVVAIHDLSEYDGCPYFAMEYIEGETLSQRIKRLQKLSPSDALPTIKQAALGLQAALENGLIHRDVKPSNIMINEKGLAKLTDFGLVMNLLEPSELTHSDMILGSPHYMSPEQAHGEKGIDFRTDIYSLGITLYHALTGKLPFNAETPMGIMLKHVNNPIPELNLEIPNIDTSILQLVKKMTNKNRDDRYQSYDELIQDINSSLRIFSTRSSDQTFNPLQIENTHTPTHNENSNSDNFLPLENMIDTTDTVNVSNASATKNHKKITPTTNAENTENTTNTENDEEIILSKTEISAQAVTKKQKIPIPNAYSTLGGLTGTLFSVYTKPEKSFKQLSRGRLNVGTAVKAGIICIVILICIIPLGRDSTQMLKWYKGYSIFLLTDILFILPVYLMSQKKTKKELSDKKLSREQNNDEPTQEESAFTKGINLLLFSWIAQIWFSARWLFFLAFPTPWIAYCGLEHLLKIKGSRLKLVWLVCICLFVFRILVAISFSKFI